MNEIFIQLKVVIPSPIIQKYELDEIRAILAHELAIIKSMICCGN